MRALLLERSLADNQMGDRVSATLMQRFRERSAKNGIIEKVDLPDYEVQAVRPKLILFTGNMHLGADRVLKRKDVNKRFAKLKF